MQTVEIQIKNIHVFNPICFSIYFLVYDRPKKVVHVYIHGIFLCLEIFIHVDGLDNDQCKVGGRRHRSS